LKSEGRRRAREMRVMEYRCSSYIIAEIEERDGKLLGNFSNKAFLA
jgi:hypothetical protein